MSQKLSTETLEHTNVGRFSYPREDLGVGIVHFGLGRFHRGHQALYNDLLLDKKFGPWGISGISLRNRTSVNELTPQNYLYTVIQKSNTGEQKRIVGCLKEALFLGDGLDPIINRIVHHDTRIITFTITEKGYYFNQASHQLDFENSDIIADMQMANEPKSSLGVLCLGLYERYKRHQMPITLLSCDNLKENGLILKTVVFDYISKVFPEMLGWLAMNVSFPSSMVDRIVPALKDEEKTREQKELGFEDQALIKTEIFGQWVVEDDFKAGRPDWQDVGVEFVSDVKLYEKMKLTFLNGTHSYLAYHGPQKGYEFVHQAIEDDEIRSDIETLFEKELSPLLNGGAQKDFSDYAASLIERYKNADLNHALLQISMDGSVKIPQRWLPAIHYNLQNDHPIEVLSRCIAIWYEFARKAFLENAWELSDPNKEKIQELIQKNERNILAAMKEMAFIFDQKLLASTRFLEEVSNQYEILTKQG